MLAEIDYFLKDLNRGIGRIQNGEVPDGSGNEIGNNGTLTNYWFKPGISDPFTAFMSKESGSGGTISSTAHSNKGKILLGSSTAYDEANVRLGIGTTSPTAMLHISSSATTIYARPNGTSGGIGSWRGQDGGSTNLQNYVNETVADDSNYLTEPSVPGTLLKLVLWTAGNIPFSGSPTITMRFRVKRVLPSAGTEQFHFDLYRDATLVTAQNSGVLSTAAFVDYSYTLSGSEVNSLFNAGANGSTLDIYAVGLGTNGYDVSYVAMEISSGSSQTLARWDTNGTQSGRITTEGYVESQRLNLTGTTSGTVTFSGGTAPTSHTYTVPTAQGAASTLLQNDGAGALSWVTGASIVDVARTWTTLQKFPDDKIQVVGSSSNAKTLSFELDGAGANADLIVDYRSANDRSLIWTLNGAAGNDLTFSTTLTGDRVITIPDVTGTLPTLENTQIFTAGNTFLTDTNIGQDLAGFTTVGVDTASGGTPIGGTYGLRLDDASGFFGLLATNAAIPAVADWVLTLPTVSTQLVGNSETVTLTNKTLSTNTNLRFVANSDSQCIFQDSAVTTRQLGLTLNGLTAATNSFLAFIASAARTWTFGDYSGNVAIDSGVVCYEDEVLTYDDDLLVA